MTQQYECDLTRIVTSKQPLSEQHVQYFTYQILRGTKYIHTAHVLHRDLKPGNLLVMSSCDLAICDFGLSRGVTENSTEPLTEYVVTRWYRAPELLCECANYGPAVDVWSIGCIMAEILSREPLLRGMSTPHQLELIVKLLGTPTEDDLYNLQHTHGAPPAVIGLLRSMPAMPKYDLARILPSASPAALDLLSKLLVFDPSKRITVEVRYAVITFRLLSDDLLT